MCPRAHVTRVDYLTNDTCATVHVRHATTDRSTRALPTRGHAQPSVHLADRRITNICTRRSLYYSTRACPLHVGTPAHVRTVYGRPVTNLRARAGRYTIIGENTRCLCSDILYHVVPYSPAEMVELQAAPLCDRKIRFSRQRLLILV